MRYTHYIRKAIETVYQIIDENHDYNQFITTEYISDFHINYRTLICYLDSLDQQRIILCAFMNLAYSEMEYMSWIHTRAELELALATQEDFMVRHWIRVLLKENMFFQTEFFYNILELLHEYKGEKRPDEKNKKTGI